MGLFEMLNEKFKSQHNETILLLQYCKTLRHNTDGAKERMVWSRIKGNECKYQEYNR